MHTCGICKKSDITTTFGVREMQFGTREVFDYFECDGCGCVQIVQIPSDMARHYENYYSFKQNKASVEEPQKPNRKREVLQRILLEHYFNRKSLPGHLAKLSSLRGDFPYWITRAKLNLGLTKDSSILDVGCGGGEKLLNLETFGFTKLMGIDPYIDKDREISANVRIFKRSLMEMDGEFDLVMFNHSFEHMSEPFATLSKAYELVKPGKFLVIRVPVAGSYAWRKYGVHWAALDAPRHFFLHTRKSFAILAAAVGAELGEVVFDGDGFGLWASEMYSNDIPLNDPRSPNYKPNPVNPLYTEAELRKYQAKDRCLNWRKKADSAAFCLYKRERQTR